MRSFLMAGLAVLAVAGCSPGPTFDTAHELAGAIAAATPWCQDFAQDDAFVTCSGGDEPYLLQVAVGIERGEAGPGDVWVEGDGWWVDGTELQVRDVHDAIGGRLVEG